MSNSIKTNDILWTRSGDPTLVEKKDDRTGQVFLNNDFKKVQDVSKNGIKNGLTVPERDSYKATLSNIEDNDKKKEIQSLFTKIKQLKAENTNPKLVKYLENELQYRMLHENYTPNDYGIDPVVLDI